MSETFSTPDQVQRLLDATDAGAKDWVLSGWLNVFADENRYTFAPYDADVGTAIKKDMFMDDRIAEAHATSWELDIIRPKNGKQFDYEPPYVYDALYSFVCRADRRSGIQEKRRATYILNAQAVGGPLLHRHIEPMTIGFSLTGTPEFTEALSSGYDSDMARAYIDKIQRDDPAYAVHVANIISSTCGVAEGVAPDGAPTRIDWDTADTLRSLSFEQAKTDVTQQLHQLVGGLSILKQIGRSTN
jgi:hypothetical protein